HGCGPGTSLILVGAFRAVNSEPGAPRTPRSGRLPWVQDNLRPAFFPGIEVLVSLCCLVEGQVVGNDPGRLDLAFGDEAAQVPVVALHRALTGAHVLALEPEVAEVERGLAVLGQLIRPAGVLRDIYADGAESSGKPHRRDQVIQRGGIVFMAS